MPLSFESGPLRAYQAIGDLAGRCNTNGRRRLQPAPTSEQHTRTAISTGSGERRESAAACRSSMPSTPHSGWFRGAGRSSHEERGGRYLAYGAPPVTAATISVHEKTEIKGNPPLRAHRR